MREIGWILDIYIYDRCAVLWVKLIDGKMVRLTDNYRPDFYIELNDGFEPEDVAETISLHPYVYRVEVEKKYTSILSREKSSVIHVFTSGTSSFKPVKRDLEKLNVVKSWFNIDLYHFQRYLFSKSFAPTNKVEVKWSDDQKLVDIAVLDDSCEVGPPPFSSLLFKMNVESQALSLDVRRDHISRIALQIGDGEEEILDGTEPDILAKFSSRVSELDPDFLVINDYKEALHYIFERAKILGVSLQLGRESAKSYDSKDAVPPIRGRAIVDLNTFREYGVAGICELSRFTLAPPTFSAKWPAGKTIDARQSYEALKKDILVPKKRSFPRFAMTAGEINKKDKGGLLFSPVVGLHENVAELDFESTFPNIIIHYNISYETVTPTHIDRTRQGFLGEVVRIVLDRRLHYKHLREKFQKNSKEYVWCDQRQKALKIILVCIYGFSGCFANRFNNVTAYNEINAISRQLLVQTVNICLARGFEIIYCNTDSIFVKRQDATRGDYEKLASIIKSDTGLPLSLNNHYKFIVFMRQETHPDAEAMNHFFGKLTNDEFNCRGIELRRGDCPTFLKKFQSKLIELLFDADNSREVIEKGMVQAKNFTQDIYSQVIKGNVDPVELAISKHVHRKVNTYKSIFPHVVAAKHLAQQGKRIEEYATVDFVFTNAKHSNPLRRVIPIAMMENRYKYCDREKYGKLILSIADTILKTLQSEQILSPTLDTHFKNE